MRRRHPGGLRLEPGQRAAPGDRQARSRRPRLHPGHVRRIGIVAGLPAGRPARPCRSTGARRPRQPERLRAAHGGCQVRLRAHRGGQARRPGPGFGRLDLRRASAAGCGFPGRRGIRGRPAAVRPDRRPALLRPGVRGASAGAGRAGRAAGVRPGARRGGGSGVPRRARTTVRVPLPRRSEPAGGVGEPAGDRDRADPSTRAAPAADRRSQPGAGPDHHPFGGLREPGRRRARGWPGAGA